MKYLDKNGLTYFYGKVKDEIDTKQDTLTAGTNITIQNNVISATGGGSVDVATTSEVDAIFDTVDTTSVFLLATSSAWQTSPYCYIWVNGYNTSAYASWAGEPMTITSMTYNDYPIYKYTIPSAGTYGDYNMCIFSQNSSGSNQTSNLNMQKGKVYNPSTNTWLDIRTVPLENNKVISIEGLNEYDTRIKGYVNDTITGALGGSY